MAIASIFAVFLTACGINDKPYDLHNNSNNMINTDDVEVKNEMNDENFGFVRQVKSPAPEKRNLTPPIKWLNREETADNISKMAVALPNVEDASVLVTDQEVLIAYLTSEEEEKARFETADKVKRLAMTAVPRWYHVYVTDDPLLKQDVRNIASMNTSFTNKDNIVKQTVELMLERSPQGREISNRRNANGEWIDGNNQELKKNNYRQQMEE